MIVFTVLMLPYFKWMPIFDGGAFWNCIKEAVARPFDIHHYLCFDHPSLAVSFLFAIPESLWPGNLIAMHSLMLVLGLGAVVAFSSILAVAVPGKNWAILRGLGTVLFAMHPVMVANAISFNLDTVLLFYFLPFLALLLRGNVWGAAIVGSLLAFTKETGILLYSLAVFFYALSVVFPESKRSWKAYERILKRYLPLLIPPLLFAGYILMHKVVWKTYPFHQEHHMGTPSEILFKFDPFDKKFHIFLAEIFLFQFGWMLSFFLFFASVVGMLRTRLFFKLGSFGPTHRRVLMLSLLFVTALYFLTRAMPYNNLRYLLPLYPMLIVLSLVSLRYVMRDLRAATGIVVLIIAFALTGLFRSTDPVMQMVLGTVKFGDHVIYPMARVVRDGCCGYGRDQQFYNLEYVKLIELQQEVLKTFAFTPETFVVIHPDILFWFPDSIDPKTRELLPFTEGLKPRYLRAEELLDQEELPEHIYYVQYPFFDNTRATKLLRERYETVKASHPEIDGYFINVWEMKRKGD